MILKTGLVFCSIAALLFACWGLGAVLIAKEWNPIGAGELVLAFGFVAAIFKWPTLAVTAVGVLCVGIGLAQERKA